MADTARVEVTTMACPAAPLGTDPGGTRGSHSPGLSGWPSLFSGIKHSGIECS